MARKVLVSLVSDQTIPNVLFIKTIPEYDDYIFITTKLMKERQKTQAICNATGIKYGKKNEITVLESNVENITQKIASFYNAKNGYVVNITGGNKLIFLSVYNFFNILNIPIYYKPIDENSFIGLNQGKKAIKINHKLTVKQYLNAYNIDYEKINTEFFPKKALNKILKDFEKSDFKINDFIKDKPTEQKLFFTGGWFEQFCYHKIKDTLMLSENEIEINVEVFHFGKKNRNTNDNEFDIIFVKNNQLYVVEAKVSIGNKKTNELTINQVLFKLSALNKNFGLRSHAYIFTLADIYAENHNFTEDLQRRLKILSINTILDRNIIKNNEKFITEIKKI